MERHEMNRNTTEPPNLISHDCNHEATFLSSFKIPTTHLVKSSSSIFFSLWRRQKGEQHEFSFTRSTTDKRTLQEDEIDSLSESQNFLQLLFGIQNLSFYHNCSHGRNRSCFKTTQFSPRKRYIQKKMGTTNCIHKYMAFFLQTFTYFHWILFAMMNQTCTSYSTCIVSFANKLASSSSSFSLSSPCQPFSFGFRSNAFTRPIIHLQNTKFHPTISKSRWSSSLYFSSSSSSSSHKQTTSSSSSYSSFSPSSSLSAKSDNQEWNALLAAFQMYKAAYGDLKVPSRFVVPSMSPWPESAWGIKLGQRVAAIRSTGKYVEEDTQRRKILDDMGFLWRLRAQSPDNNMSDTTTFDQIYTALVTFKELQPKNDIPTISSLKKTNEIEEEQEYDENEEEEEQEDFSSSSFNIPRNFVVPNYAPWPEETRGLPLGKMVAMIRSKAYLKANPGAAEKLESIGFQLNGKTAVNDAKFSVVYKALETYKRIHGDLLVPQPFAVPDKSSDWPEETWGLRLGARVNAIRSQGTFIKTNPERKNILDDLGFEWETPPIGSSGKKRGRKKKGEQGDDVDDIFDDEDFSDISASSPTGRLDKGKDKTEVDADDNDDMAISLDDDDYDDNTDDYSPMYSGPNAALGSTQQSVRDKAILDKNADMGSKQNSDDTYRPPKDLNATLTAAAEMAKAVGVIESLGEGKRVVKGKIEKRFPWVLDDFGEGFVFEDVVEALTIYKKITGSFAGLETKEFIVPDSYFNTESVNLEASSKAAARIKKAQLRGENSEALIAAEIRRMESVIEGSSKESEWPEHLAGMKLGCIVHRIRDGSLEVKHLPERKAQLGAIGFNWGDPKRFLDVPFEKAMCAMFAYFLIRGDLFVYEDFVMPYDEPWPSVLGGFELGKAVRRIQELQHFFETYHPEKLQLLRMVEFSWFPELALPLNPEDGEETWEDMYVEGVGHPFYHLNEPSVEMIETLQSQGPSSGIDDSTKSWYNYDVVKDYWRKGDLTDLGKGEREGRWNAAEWLWWNGFNQLSEEHEEKYGISPGLELTRLLAKYNGKQISEEEFDEAALEVMKSNDLQEIRAEAQAAGIDINDDDDWDVVLQKIMEDPEIQALDSDPEYQRLVQAELEAEEERIRTRMEKENNDDEDNTIVEKEIDFDEVVVDDDEKYEEETFDDSFAVL